MKDTVHVVQVAVVSKQLHAWYEWQPSPSVCIQYHHGHMAREGNVLQHVPLAIHAASTCNQVDSKPCRQGPNMWKAESN
jgi:hypothetical protein